jgi:hypothetical protein
LFHGSGGCRSDALSCGCGKTILCQTLMVDAEAIRKN